MPSRRDVRSTFERIGEHFAQTRASPWPEVESFLDGRASGTALDVGCGNGRHAALLAGLAGRTVGVDASETLLAVAAERLSAAGHEVALLQGDATRLPLAGSAVDLALYVATIHHLPTADQRIASLDELARVLRPGGAALVSAWATTHDRFDRESGFDTTVDWTLPGGETVDRYYHVYDPGEFEATVADSDLVAEDLFTSSGNCYAVVRAPADRRPG